MDAGGYMCVQKIHCSNLHYELYGTIHIWNWIIRLLIWCTVHTAKVWHNLNEHCLTWLVCVFILMPIIIQQLMNIMSVITSGEPVSTVALKWHYAVQISKCSCPNPTKTKLVYSTVQQIRAPQYQNSELYSPLMH